MDSSSLPGLAEVDVDLVPHRTLGAPGDLVRGQIGIGRSEATRLRPGGRGVGHELIERLISDEDTHHYYQVSLSCTFRASDAPVVYAVFSIQLVQAAVADVPHPQVWSMDPLRRTTPVKHRRALTFGPDVKIVPEILGVEGSIERSTEYSSDLPHLVAHGEGERQAEWVFTATRAVSLTGVHHLNFVARTSARVACRADLALAAKRQEKLLGLVPYRADIPPDIRTIRFSEV